MKKLSKKCRKHLISAGGLSTEETVRKKSHLLPDTHLAKRLLAVQNP